MCSIPLSILIMPFTQSWRDAEQKRKIEFHEKQLADDALITKNVGLCLESKGPWKCFERVLELDAKDKPRIGELRVSRLAAISPAKEALLFCDLPRKVDCANKMIGHGYNVTEVKTALRSRR